MTGKNITYKEMMQYMIAENVHKTLEDMLREAGYEIGDGAGQVLVESVSGMVREMVISTDRLEKGDKRTMSKEHPDGYYYRIPCAILARTNPGRRCYEDTYLQVVFVAGQVKTWGQKITMIWAGSDGAKMLGPDEGDIMWSESVFDRHEYHLDGKFDPFRGKSMTAGINDPEEEEAEEQVEAEETADVEETETEETAEQEQKGVYNSEYWKRISRRLKTIIADGKPAKETRKGYPYKKLVNDMLRLEATCYVKRLIKDAGYEIDMLHGAFVYPARGVVLSAYPMWDEDGFFTEFDHPSDTGYEYTAKVPIQYGGAQKNVRTLIIYGEIGKYGHTVNSIMDEDSEEVVWNRFESVRNAYGIEKFDPWNGAVAVG